MLTCWEMSELGSDIIDQKLSFNSRMAVMMHISMCKNCHRYIKQLTLTSDVLKMLPLPVQPQEVARVLAAIESQDQK